MRMRTVYSVGSRAGLFRLYVMELHGSDSNVHRPLYSPSGTSTRFSLC